MMINLFILSVLLAAGSAIGHQGISDHPSLPTQDACYSPNPRDITPSPQIYKKNQAIQIHKRDICTNQPCLYRRKQASPPPSPNRNGNRPHSPNPGGTSNRPATPFPAPIGSPPPLTSLGSLTPWRGNPPPLPLPRAMPPFPPERPRPLSPDARAISRPVGADGTARTPHDPVFFGRPASQIHRSYVRLSNGF